MTECDQYILQDCHVSRREHNRLEHHCSFIVDCKLDTIQLWRSYWDLPNILQCRIRLVDHNNEHSTSRYEKGERNDMLKLGDYQTAYVASVPQMMAILYAYGCDYSGITSTPLKQLKEEMKISRGTSRFVVVKTVGQLRGDNRELAKAHDEFSLRDVQFMCRADMDRRFRVAISPDCTWGTEPILWYA